MTFNHILLSIPVLACSIGTYGEGCKEECGHCHNQTSCDHVNGSCLDECQPGYIGSQCKISRLRAWNPSRKAILMLYSNIWQDPFNICLSRQHWLNKNNYRGTRWCKILQLSVLVYPVQKYFFQTGTSKISNV